MFFEPLLSKSQQISCASCHDSEQGWADGKRKAIGHQQQQHDLNTPSIINVAFLSEIFWDGRAKSLEAQVIQTWQSPIEMAANIPAAVQRIQNQSNYKAQFEAAFGDTHINAGRIATAIANYMRTITLTDTRFDQFMRGDRTALTAPEIKGLHVFRTKGQCMNCHHGALLTDNDFHHLGSSFHHQGNFKGRYAVTAKPEHVGAFRTPGLRGVSATAPYLHNGFARSLEALLNLYNDGWWQNAPDPNDDSGIPYAKLSPLINELNLSREELTQLQAFLHSLDGSVEP